MIALVAGLVLQIGAPSYAAIPGVDSFPRDAVVDSLRVAESRFMQAWRREWLGTRKGKGTYLRLASLHCHRDGSWQSGAPNIIRSAESSRSFCPVWFPVEDSLPADENDGVDASLPEASRRIMRESRAALIARFQSAARARPADAWLPGQLVRLAIDQGEIETARSAARACTRSSAWCLLLQGYVEQAAGRIAPADTIFSRAVAAMRPAERCLWTSVAPLLDARSRAAYERIDCANRDSVDATFWWLADPLYLEPGNARRVEHFARQVLIRLHASGGADERWDWRPGSGGDALAAMIVRYGWPSQLYWAGYYEMNGHYDWLGFRDSTVDVAPEYELPRYHSAPSWSAVLDPATLSRDDASRFAPKMAYGAVDWDNDFWPVEHALRPLGPVIDLPEQMVIFRRDNDALLAIGMDVPQKFFAPGARIPYDAAIIAARDATDRWVPSRESLVLDGRGTTVLVSPLSSRAQIISAELAPADAAPGLAVRVRRAVRPPAPLSVLQAGEVAISDPLFYRPGDATEPPANAPEAVGRMFGSLALGEKRVGVFWEMYGVAPGDTVDVSLHFTSLDKPGLLRRFGSAVGVADAESGEMTVTWREPRPREREATIYAGDVPIQSRAVTLDVSRMRPGRYTVEITVAKHGAVPASSRRDVTIVR